jgi:hypothetical protein
MDPELAEAKAKADLAAQLAAEAKAESELFGYKIGALTSDQLIKGTVAANDAGIEGRIRAYTAMQATADYLVQAAKPQLNGKTVVLFSDAQLATLNQYRSFLAQKKILELQASAVLKKKPDIKLPAECGGGSGPKAAFAPPLLALNAAISLLGVFKSDVDVKNSTFTMSEYALMASLARSLQAEGISVIYPPSFYALAPSSPSEESAVLKAAQDIVNKQVEIQDAADEVARGKAALVAPTGASELCKHAIARVTADADRYLAVAKQTTGVLDEVLKALSKPDTGVAAITAYMQAEKLEQKLSGDTILLQAKAVEAGGGVRTKRNILYSTISYSGGSVVSYMLMDAAGALLAADTIPWYEGPVKADDYVAKRVAPPSPDEKKGIAAP